MFSVNKKLLVNVVQCRLSFKQVQGTGVLLLSNNLSAFADSHEFFIGVTLLLVSFLIASHLVLF